MQTNNLRDLCPKWRDMLHATSVTHPYIDGNPCVLSYGGLKGPGSISEATSALNSRAYVPENTVEFTLELWVRPALLDRAMEVLDIRTRYIQDWFRGQGYIRVRSFRGVRRSRGPLSSEVELFVFQARIPQDRADQLRSDVEAFLAEQA
jgi:hypothetical protein